MSADKAPWRKKMLADLKRSGLTGTDAKRMRLEVLAPDETAEALRIPLLRFWSYRIPYFDSDGALTDFFRVRFLEKVLDRKGKLLRYMQPRGSAPHAYFAPGISWRSILKDTSHRLAFTEGEKKAAKGCNAGLATVGIGGIWSWKSQMTEILDELTDVALDGRAAWILFDGSRKGTDAAARRSNADVEAAANAFGARLGNRGARTAIISLPEEMKLDDYLLKHDLEDLEDLPRRWLGAPDPTDAIREIEALEFDTAEKLRERDPRPLRAIVADLLYPGAYILTGRAKIGKSWLCMQLALTVANNGTFLGFKCNCPRAEVLAIFAEDTDARLNARLKKFGVQAPAGIHLVNRTDFTGFANKYSGTVTFIEFFEAWLSKHPRVKLVIVDTESVVRQVWLGERDEKKLNRITDTDYKQVRVFDELAHRHGVAILLNNHSRKLNGRWHDIHELINRTGSALAGASGSLSMADAPDADPTKPISGARLLGIRGRDVEHERTLVIQQEGGVAFTSKGDYHEVQQTENEEELLQGLLELSQEKKPGEFVTTKELAAHFGKKENTVKTALKRMTKAGRRTWNGYALRPKHGVGLRLEKVANGERAK
jgi:AAA domain-containing protein/uncharacterized protein DUF3854